MPQVPTLRLLENSKIDIDNETLHQVEEEITLDNITPEEFEKLSNYKRKIDNIVVRLGHDETKEFLEKIDSYANELIEKEELRDIDLGEYLLFQFISPEENESEVREYDLSGDHSIEIFLVQILDSY